MNKEERVIKLLDRLDDLYTNASVSEKEKLLSINKKIVSNKDCHIREIEYRLNKIEEERSNRYKQGLKNLTITENNDFQITTNKVLNNGLVNWVIDYFVKPTEQKELIETITNKENLSKRFYELCSYDKIRYLGYIEDNYGIDNKHNIDGFLMRDYKDLQEDIAERIINTKTFKVISYSTVGIIAVTLINIFL